MTHRQPPEPRRPPGRTATPSGLLRAIPETSPGPPPTRDNSPASLAKLNRREPYDRKDTTRSAADQDVRRVLPLA